MSMHFLPTPYPDEILYSVLARYSVRSGNLSDIYNIDDIYGTRNIVPSLELPSKIDAIISNLPVGSAIIADDLIYKHTLFPYYATFLDESRAKAVYQSMRTGDGIAINLAGIKSYVKYFRYCPLCLENDMNTYGETYWHRIHQVPGVIICPKHKVVIKNSGIAVRGKNRQCFIPAIYGSLTTTIEANSDLSAKAIDLLNQRSQDIEDILTSEFYYHHLLHFKNLYMASLIEKEYAHYNRMVHEKRLQSDFIDFYGEDVLRRLNLYSGSGDLLWLRDLIRFNQRPSPPICHILLSRFLGIKISELLYETNDTQNLFDKVWAEEILRLASDKKSIRSIAKQLHSTPRTIKIVLENAGVHKYWFPNGGEKTKRSYFTSNKFEMMQSKKRTAWCHLLISNPNLSKNQLRMTDQTTYTWLYRNDRAWLNQHTPATKSSITSVDWGKRDREYCEKAKIIIDQMKTDYPEKITLHGVGTHLGIARMLYKGKMPITTKLIQSECEDLKTYQLRKIRWAIGQQKENGNKISFSALLEKAGVKPRYINSLCPELIELLNIEEIDILGEG